MTRFDDAVRHDLATAPEPAPLGRLQRLTRRRKLRRLVAGIAPLLVVAVGVGIFVGPTRHSSSVSVHPTAPQQTTPQPTIPATTSPTTVSHRTATARIELSTATMVRGSTSSAVVVVENDTGHAIRASGCVALFQIALTSPTASFEPGELACLQVFTIPAGESRYPVRVIATYSECVQGKPQGPVKSCLANGDAPPLPAGEYHAVLYDPAHAVQPPLAPTVRITSP